MKRVVVIAAWLLSSSPLYAQVADPGAYSGALQLGTISAMTESYQNGAGLRDNEEQRIARLTKALALRDEAQQLLAADGGKFTLEHKRYIWKKIAKILGE
jgi:hypothetical protein